MCGWINFTSISMLTSNKAKKKLLNWFLNNPLSLNFDLFKTNQLNILVESIVSCECCENIVPQKSKNAEQFS